MGGAFLALSVAPGFACLQGERFHPSNGLDAEVAKLLKLPPPPVAVGGAPPQTLRDSGRVTLGMKALQLTEAEERVRYSSFVREFELKPAGAASFNNTTDYAVALVHLGRTAEAIKVLLALEEESPGTYRTAVNLGTAYELDGQLENAATWIAKGIERNAQGHAGTEWLHAAILRARIGLRADAAWFKQHDVVEGITERSADEIVRAIEYQLAERLQFVKPQDAVVCDLFYQAARRVSGPGAAARRAFYLRESLRFGDWRKAEVSALLKS